MKLLIINGPNLNMLGVREPEVYDSRSYEDLVRYIEEFAGKNMIEADIYQSNSEGALIDKIHTALGSCDGIIINPGAYTHYSYALHDAIKATGIDAIEVHLTNIAAREEFRRRSVVAPACAGQISGFGFEVYTLAMRYFIERTLSRA